MLLKWKSDFSSLFNRIHIPNDINVQYNGMNSTELPFNDNISILEVKNAVDKAKMGKATGVDNIPSEVLKNDTTISFMHVLFNVCFDAGVVPSLWGKCIINPLPKSSTSDPGDPLSYRGIALASAVYKVYCAIINGRLSSWAETNDKLADEQNGFRKKRSTVDHISSLSNLIDTRKKLKKSTFTAFIDFKKAYDFINRCKLWSRLNESGISGKILIAIKSIYSSVSSCVRVNSFTTEWLM